MYMIFLSILQGYQAKRVHVQMLSQLLCSTLAQSMDGFVALDAVMQSKLHKKQIAISPFNLRQNPFFFFSRLKELQIF